jgi:hypothetical protein
MSSNNEITVETIDTARAEIVKMFADQCEYGAQTKSFSSDGFASCGQFIGEAAKGLAQRGIHGTAAAIAVLSNARNDDVRARELVPRLVRYASERRTADPSENTKAQTDDDNVIKVSELLASLGSVPSTTVPNTDKLKRHLTALLRESLLENKGWSYFRSDVPSGPQILPTAYAVIALDAVNEDVSAPSSFLIDNISKVRSGAGATIETDTDVTIRTVALYALTFRKHADRRSQMDGRQQEVVFDGLWNRLEQLLRAESIEQNIEYWSGSHTQYVRVPWQLYLLALAARIRISRFASRGAQARICEIVSSLARRRFRYPHSGRMISSRTNAIAFEVLGHVRAELVRSKGFRLLVLKDNIASWHGWRWIAGSIAGLVILYSIWEWACGRSENALMDLAPNFICPLVIYVLLWARGR